MSEFTPPLSSDEALLEVWSRCIILTDISASSTLGWRWIEWIMAFVAFGTCGLIFMFYPETQYSKVLAVHGSPRFWQDNLRFWPASGSRTAKYPR